MNYPTSLAAAVTIHDGRPTTTSLEVSKFFGKNHKDVLRDIRRLTGMESGLSEPFSQRNFAPRDYKDDRGKTWEMFELTFNGFIMLTMGYTGPKATAIKEAYIAEFDRMRAELDSIKGDALRKAHKQLERRNEDWPTIKREYLSTSGLAERIEQRHGYGRGKVSRNVRRMVEWGYMREQDVAMYKRLHREFGAALKALQVRKMELALEQE